jgi:taurine dioxygenase
MKEKESDALLSFLYDHIDSPEYHCRFHWTPNAIAMWDNRITQHRVVADDPGATRVMQRLTLAGEVPV